MNILKRCLFILLLLSGQCFAGMSATSSDYFLYYLNTGNSDPHLFYGKITRETQSVVEFDKLAEVQVDGCPIENTQNLMCKINAFLQADKSNRSAMVKVQVNKPVMVAVAQMVLVNVD